MSGSDMNSGGQTMQYAYEVTDPELARKARMTVARHATDVADCTELLQMLGLIPTPGVDS